MVFIETPVFTRLVTAGLTDEDYGAFQEWLAGRPDVGTAIRGGGGIRKVRWALPGRGKSGGIRVIYFWRVNQAQILLLTLYAKNERTDLSDAQVRQLAKYVKALK